MTGPVPEFFQNNKLPASKDIFQDFPDSLTADFGKILDINLIRGETGSHAVAHQISALKGNVDVNGRDGEFLSQPDRKQVIFFISIKKIHELRHSTV